MHWEVLMKLKKMSLKKAKGLRYDIDVDIDGKPGIIGIVGSNGVGKSTLEWQMLPYTIDILKGWNLKNRFYKGGEKHLVYELKGDTHEINIAFNKSDPMCSYKINGEEQNPSLKQTLFEQVIEEKFMPLYMATHSIYSVEATAIGRGKSQKLTSSLALLDPKDRKQYFIQLFGLDIYDKYKEIAKEKLSEIAEKKKEVETAYAYHQTAIEGMETLLPPNEIEEMEKRIKALPALIDKAKKEVEAYTTYQKYLSDLEDYSEIFIQKCSKYNVKDTLGLKSILKEKQGELEKLKASQEDLKEMQRLQSAIKNEKIVSGKLHARLEAITKMYAQAQEGKQAKEDLAQLKQKEIKLKSQLEILKSSEKARLGIDNAMKSIPCDNELQGKCGLYMWASKVVRGGFAEEIKIFTSEMDELLLKQASIDSKIQSLAKDMRNAARELGINMQQLDIEMAQATADITTQEEKIKDLEAQLAKIEVIDGLEAKIKQMQDEIFTLEKDIDYLVYNEPHKVEKAQMPFADPYALTTELAELKHKIENNATAVEHLKSLEEKLNAEKKELEKYERDYNEYKFLSEVFDKNGIVAFELEHLCPVVTDKANELLKNTQYEMEIVTYEYKNKGTSKEKIKDVFNITVMVDGEKRDYMELSAGQRVLPDLALAQAVSIVLGQTYNMQSIFIDERDGSLSIDNKLPFVDMLRKAHTISGRVNTFIISHDPAVWTACDWVIYLSGDKYTVDRPENLSLENL